jgi:hypothetical protein
MDGEIRVSGREWLRAEEVTELLGVTTGRLRSWRVHGYGPAYRSSIFKGVLYDPRSIASFRRSRPSTATWRRVRPRLGMRVSKK